jgi:tetratricopeptide (TPR) repeat protein
LYQSGRLAEADRLFAQLLVDFPNESDVHRWVATILYDKGELNPAMGALERASQLAPDDFQPHQLMALTYVQEFRQYEDAIRHYRLALERNPPEGLRQDIQRELAQCLVFQKEFAEALDLVRQLPVSPRQQMVQIEALRGLGEIEEARAVWERLQQTAPKGEGVALLGALLDLDQERATNALGRLRTVLTREPHNVVARNQMIRACQMLGETDRAKAEADQLQVSQALHERHDRLATQALAEPGNTTVRRELARLCDQLGRRTDAARWRRSAAVTRN